MEPTSKVNPPQQSAGIPELVLQEHQDGTVQGVLMWELRSSSHVAFASKYVEPDEVAKGIAILRCLEPGESYGNWRKGADVAAASLEEAIASTPETNAGQKFVCLYRGDEWRWGIWTNPDRYPSSAGNTDSLLGVNLRSVADFHGTRVSAAKRSQREGLENVQAHQAIAGSYDVLRRAIELVRQSNRPARQAQDYEAHPAVHHLCDWWNSRAPDGSQFASVVRLYVWNDQRRVFNPCDPEEPAALASQVATWASYALFEATGKPTVLACFFRGRSFNKSDGTGATTVFAADGTDVMSLGLDADEVDEAYYSLVGLETLATQEFL